VKRPTRRVDPTELRRIFNDGQYYDRVVRNEWTERIESERPARPEAGQVAGTMSRMVWYFDESGSSIALVHEYRAPDGSLGGSGRPDPKRISLDNEILYC